MTCVASGRYSTAASCVCSVSLAHFAAQILELRASPTGQLVGPNFWEALFRG
jgi:hypothetical protein